MNERLHQLMRQAQSEAYANACAKNKTQSPQNNTVWNEFPEVFAELIVLECARWLGNREFASPEALKQHFGVNK